MDYPDFDPHGNPIPNKKGEIKVQYKKTLAEISIGKSCKMVAVKDNSSTFLQYISKVGLKINNKVKVLSVQDYDLMMEIEINGQHSSVSQKFAENIFVENV